MCKQCPRRFKVKRYWDLPHWMTERQYLKYLEDEARYREERRRDRELNDE